MPQSVSFENFLQCVIHFWTFLLVSWGCHHKGCHFSSCFWPSTSLSFCNFRFKPVTLTLKFFPWCCYFLIFFLRRFFPSVGLVVLAMIKCSVSSAVVLPYIKHAVMQLFINKPDLDQTVLANFRPLSKLPFLSNILENIVYTQVKTFGKVGDILHCTESVLSCCWFLCVLMLWVMEVIYQLSALWGGVWSFFYSLAGSPMAHWSN